MSSSHTIKADSFRVSTDGRTNDLEISKGSESVLKGNWKVDGSLKVEQGTDPKSPVTVSHLAESLVQFQKDCSEFWVPREEWEKTSNKTVEENTNRINAIEEQLKGISAKEEIDQALANFYSKGEIDLALGEVVHKTGDEYVQGDKTFLNNVVVANTEGTASLTVLPLGGKTNLGADAYGLHVSAAGGLQLFGTHFLNGDLWSDKDTGTGPSVKIVRDSVSLTSTNVAAIGFDYANEVIFRTMPNDGNEAKFCFEAWQWDNPEHWTKSPSAGVRLVKPSQKSEITAQDVLNVEEGDKRWGGGGSGGGASFGEKISIGSESFAGGKCSIAIGNMAESDPDGYQNNSVSIGACAIALGSYSTTVGSGSLSGCRSVVLGSSATSSYADSVVIGFNSSASRNYAVAIGSCTSSGGYSSVAIGYKSSIGYSADEAISIGKCSSASQSGGIAFGYKTISSGYCSAAIGVGSFSNGPESIAIGACSTSSDYSSVALGSQATSLSDSGLSLGFSSYSTGQRAVAIGACSYAGQYAIAFGAGSRSIVPGAIAIGSGTSAFSDNSVVISPSQGMGGLPASTTLESVCSTRGTSLRMMLVAGEHHPNCTTWISDDDSYIVFQSEDRLSADSFGIKIGVGAFFQMLVNHGGVYYTTSSQQEASGGGCSDMCGCSYF